ncbi:MAG TPA: hypothetical protein ENN42_07060 [Thioalkalivibrio sp.]|nr:hypothetical protein [Thioalkalivibrio sp.]
MPHLLNVTGDACQHEARDGYAFFEGAGDAVRYVQRLALLRMAQYHGCRADPAHTHCDVNATGPAGERL